MERARGIIARNLVTGKIERFAAHAVVIGTGGYGNTYFLSTNAMAPLAQGSTRFNLQKNDFMKMKFLLPSLEKQGHISMEIYSSTLS